MAGSIAHNLRHYQKRRQPRASVRQTILNGQDNRCFYCGLKFDEWFTYGGHAKKRTVCWDHLSPYALTFNSEDSNFVAACALCNSIKASRVFHTVQDAVETVREGLTKRGIQPAPVWGNKKTKKFYEGWMLTAPTTNEYELENLTVEQLKAKLGEINLSLRIIKRRAKLLEPASQEAIS